MTEEVKTEEVQEQVETPQISEVEQRAMEQGWRPKEQYEGDAAKWVDADEFLRRGELFEKIDSVKRTKDREIAQLRQSLNALETHYKRVQEVEFQRALETLKAEKKEALREGDADKVVDLDEKIAEVKDAQAEAKAEIERQKAIVQDSPAAVDPRFTAWVDRNQWYARNEEMKALADSVGLAYAKSRPGVDPQEVLSYVEKRVKAAYPENFSNPKRDKPSAVESGGGTRKGTTSVADDYTMTPDEEKVFRTLNRSNPTLFTREKYIADLRKISR